MSPARTSLGHEPSDTLNLLKAEMTVGGGDHQPVGLPVFLMAAERDPRACVQGAFTQLQSFELQVLGQTLKVLPTSGLISALEPGADFMWDLDDLLSGQKMPQEDGVLYEGT